MIRENDEVLWPTPEGDVEVVVLRVDGDEAFVIWNESATDGCGAVTGREATVKLGMLKEKP